MRSQRPRWRPGGGGRLEAAACGQARELMHPRLVRELVRRMACAPHRTAVPVHGGAALTRRVVPQLVQELVHLKGGGQRLDQARGLDGACGRAGGCGGGRLRAYDGVGVGRGRVKEAAKVAGQGQAHQRSAACQSRHRASSRPQAGGGAPLGMPTRRWASTNTSFHSRHSRWLCILGLRRGVGAGVAARRARSGRSARCLRRRAGQPAASSLHAWHDAAPAHGPWAAPSQVEVGPRAARQQLARVVEEEEAKVEERACGQRGRACGGIDWFEVGGECSKQPSQRCTSKPARAQPTRRSGTLRAGAHPARASRPPTRVSPKGASCHEGRRRPGAGRYGQRLGRRRRPQQGRQPQQLPAYSPARTGVHAHASAPACSPQPARLQPAARPPAPAAHPRGRTSMTATRSFRRYVLPPAASEMLRRTASNRFICTARQLGDGQGGSGGPEPTMAAAPFQRRSRAPGRPHPAPRATCARLPCTPRAVPCTAPRCAQPLAPHLALHHVAPGGRVGVLKVGHVHVGAAASKGERRGGRRRRFGRLGWPAGVRPPPRLGAPAGRGPCILAAGSSTLSTPSTPRPRLLSALMTILRSVGPVISTRRSCRSAGSGATRQSPSRTCGAWRTMESVSAAAAAEQREGSGDVRRGAGQGARRCTGHSSSLLSQAQPSVAPHAAQAALTCLVSGRKSGSWPASKRACTSTRRCSSSRTRGA